METMKPHADRKFYHLPEQQISCELPPVVADGNTEDIHTVVDINQSSGFPAPPCAAATNTGSITIKNVKKPKSKFYLQRRNTRGLIEMVEQNLFARDTVFQGPFGPRRNIYIDQTASGQSLRCIEDYLYEHVLPYYGNTHTTTTNTSSQTTMFRHEARDIIRNSVGASEHDAVIFCGSGATGPIHKLVQNLTSDSTKPPIVFVGPFEHHSNLLPWRDIGAEIVYIPATIDGEFDIGFLEDRLKEARDGNKNDRLLIGTFSVASNVNGILTDDVAVTILMHKYKGLALWDFSAAAPHVKINMNPVVISEDEGLAKKDALYFSGHKFVGGPQTPGVLIAKKCIFEDHVPNGGGGGTVFFVTPDGHRYLKNPEYREEGGTPAIIESIRLGLVFRLKDSIGPKNILNREETYAKRIIDSWSKCEEIKLLGTQSHPRIPIISFLIQHPESGYYLHYNFVVGLLNDLFGLQTRGGCACAGPYSQLLLGIDNNLAHTFEELLLEDSRLDRSHLRRQEECSSYEIFRPGFVRLSVPYYSSVQEAEFISEAVKLVAQHGWKLLPLYMCNPETGEFHHHLNHMIHHRKWLSWASFDSEGIKSKERTRNNSEDSPNYGECLEQARNIFANAENLCKKRNLPNQSLLFGSDSSHLRWFLLPSESLSILNGTWNQTKVELPFEVRSFPKSTSSKEYYYESSVPHQIVQSTTNVIEDFQEKRGRLADTESVGSSDFSFNDSDHEYHISGETVTGPSICFSRRSVGSIDTTPEPPFQCPLEKDVSSVCVDVLNNNHTQTQTLAEIPNLGILNSQCNNDSYCQPLNDYTQQNMEIFIPTENIIIQYPQQPLYDQPLQVQTPPNNIQQTYFPHGDIILDNETPNNSPMNSPYQNQNFNPNYAGYTCDQTYSYEIQPSPVMSNQFMNQNDLNVRMDNLNLVSYNQLVPYASPPLYNSYSNNQCILDANSAFNNTQQSNLVNGGDYRQNYGESPLQQTLGYFPSSHQRNYPTPTNYVEQQPLKLNYSPVQQNSQQSIGMSHINANDKSSQELLLRSQSSSDYHDVVNKTLRHATHIAKELKSEIRGIITQVEQGIDPGGHRERSSSFNAKDKRFDRFRRTRTLSGHLLNYSLKRSESEKSELSTESTTSTTDGSTETNEKQNASAILENQLKPKSTKELRESQGGQGPKWHCPPKNIFKPTLKALRDFSMIENGDRVLVCLSGGKDSLSLLHTVKQAQHVLAKEGIAFSFGAVTVDPGSSAYDPKPLIPYLKALDVTYFFEEQGIMPTALEKGPECVTSICSFCSRLKRGRIYATARANNYNVLAFGQHLDDLTESFFMSIFHNGLLRTMKAAYVVKEEDLRVIRPFVNVREKSLREFAESRGLPIISENCPACFDAPTERYRIKQLLAQQEILFPKIFVSLRTAMHPLISITKTGMETAPPEAKRKHRKKVLEVQNTKE